MDFDLKPNAKLFIEATEKKEVNREIGRIGFVKA
jgi:hypothetical protein